jgi:hypothetical protein
LRFRSVPRVLKQAVCFVGRDRYKAFGSMSDMAIYRQYQLTSRFHGRLCPDCQPNGQISRSSVHREEEWKAYQN